MDTVPRKDIFLEVREVIDEKNFLLAEKILKDFIATEPGKDKLYEAKFMLAYVYLSQNRNREALNLFEEISNLKNPHKRSADATFMAGILYERKFNDRKNARRYYEMYLEKWPQRRLAKKALEKLKKLK
ncbi:MAG: hypothetical protein J7L42_00705 [Elusimicrobia bacterium]|nr:hypothetical protein [Elusimicrobiota bacterium]